MKRFIYTLILGICTALFSSCSGTSIDDPELMDGKIHLKADKTSIMADGVDCVTFTVKRDGEDLSNAKTMQLEVTDEDGSISTLAEGANTFSSTKAGKYSIRAKYYESGYTYSEETIEISVDSIGESKYKHVLLGMEFTSEGCTACPNFAKTLEVIKEENSDKMVVVAFHMDFGGVKDFLSLNESTTYLQSLGARTALPQFYFNIRKTDENLITRDKVLKAMAEELTIPNTCGVAIDTRYDDASRKLNITAKITSDVEKEYRYLVFLVEDNIPQRLQGVQGFVHQNVVRKVLTSTIGDRFPVEYRPVPANQEVAVVLPEVEIPADWNTENMRVVVSMVNSLDGGKSYTSNNTTQCKLGESVDYSYSGISDGVKDEKIYLKADKTSIVSDGLDCVTFTVECKGNDLSNADNMELEVTAEDGSVSTLPKGTNTFSSTKAGKYSIRAKYYEGGFAYSEETIEIIVIPKYKHALLGMEFTSEGCTACPNFAKTLEVIKEENSDKMVVVAFHMDFGGVTDFLSLNETASYLQSLGARPALPQFYFNIRKTDESLITRDKVLKAMAEELTISNNCGVAIDTRYDSASRKLNITAKITSDVEKEYRYLVFLVEDNIPQRLQGVQGFVHQNAVRKVMTSTIGDRFPVEYRPVPANQEVAVVLPEVEIPADWNTENMRVVVSMLNSLDGGKSYTSNNTAQCKLGESVDYQLNE